MKICDITQAYNPTSGGIKTYIDEKRRYIGEMHCGTHILIVPGRRDSVTEDGISRTYHVAGFPVPGCEPYRFTLYLNRVAAILVREQPEVIEFGSPYFLPLAVSSRRRKKNSTVIGFCHTDFPAAYVKRPLQKRGIPLTAGAARRIAELYMRAIYNRFDATIVASAGMVRRMAEIGIAPVYRVNLGVDTELFHPRRRDTSLRSDLGLTDNDILLVYAGRLDEEKRIRLLVESFTTTGNAWNGHLAIMGNGPQKDYVIEQARRNERIIYRAYEDDRTRLATLLASADIYVTAGPHETFALSVIEAQASGLPVIGVRAGALIERVTDDLGLLCPADSPADMANAMRYLSANGFRQMGMRARHLIERDFSWTTTFDTLFDYYEQLHTHTKTARA